MWQGKVLLNATRPALRRWHGVLSEPQVPYNQSHLETALATTKRYTCGDNFFKLDMTCTAETGIPLNENNIARWMKHHLSEPCPLPLPCVVPVKTGSNPADHVPGHVPCVSPVEIRMAVLRALARDVKAKDTERLKAWRRHLLSCSFLYVILDSDEETWKYARQMREDLAQNYATLRLSPLQAVYQFVAFRARNERLHGKQPAKVLAEQYCMGVRRADTSEEVTNSFVDMALTIDNRMLKIERVAATLLKAEEEFGCTTPFDAVTKLHAIINKAKYEPRIVWAVDCLYDARKSTGPTLQLSLRTLQGVGTSNGGKGLIDLLNFKYDLMLHVATYLGEHPSWPAQCRENFAKALSSPVTYRVMCGFPDEKADLTWRAGWPPSAETAFQVWEAPPTLLGISHCCMASC